MNTKQLDFEAAKLKSSILTFIGSLFKELQDEEQEVKLGDNSFTIEDGQEEVKEVYLAYEDGEQKILKVGCENSRDGEWFEYNIEEMFTIEYLLLLAGAMEAMKEEAGAILIPIPYFRLYDNQTGRYMATGYNVQGREQLAEAYRTYKLGDASNEDEDVELFEKASVDDLFSMMEADEFTIEESMERFDEQDEE